MRSHFILFIIFYIGNVFLFSQGNQMQFYEDNNWITTQNEVKGEKLFNFHSSILPINQSIYFDEVVGSKYDSWIKIANLNFEFFGSSSDSIADYIRFINKNKPFLRYFNTNPSHLFSNFGKYYFVTIDPLLDIRIGYELNTSGKIFSNTRGLRLKAGIDNKVFLYSELTENQIDPLDYIADFSKNYKAFPSAGFVKPYRSSILNISQGFDYILAEGGINFNVTKHINLSIGHGKNFIGQGIRSLLMSDFSPPQFYLKFNSQFGKFRYLNIFTELSAGNRYIDGSDKLITKKYSASHYLSYNVSSKWNIGLFESVIFNRNKGFELQYLNPIILYRAVEQAIGSPDNALLAFQTHLNLFKSFTIYNQILLDEFVFKRVISSNQGWWGNKYGYQFGIKYPDFAKIPHLNAQVEYNSVRPYTYSYSDSLGSYSHYNQAIAHPLGSNFRELLFMMSYNFGSKTFLQFSAMNYLKGLDIDSLNYGGNILKSNKTRISDYQNNTGQGLNTKVMQFQWRISYEFLQRTWLDFNLGIRNSSNSITSRRTSWIELGIRMNVNSRNYLF